MKALALVLLLSFGLTAQAIDFEAQNAQQPLIIKIVKIEVGNGIRGYDSKGAYRVFAYSNGSAGEYAIYASSGTRISSIQIDKDANLLTTYLNAVDGSCSVTLEIDRTKGTILKVKASCDPLAGVKAVDHAG